MRLIDAEVLSERLLTAWNTADKEKKTEISDVMAFVVTPILVDTPTAYDIDKVVEQLRKKAYNCGSHMNIYGEKAEWMAEGYYGAIEIVKKGGAV